MTEDNLGIGYGLSMITVAASPLIKYFGILVGAEGALGDETSLSNIGFGALVYFMGNAIEKLATVHLTEKVHINPITEKINELEKKVGGEQ